MKAVIQRVQCASVSIADEIVSAINKGLVVLVGISKDDTQRDIAILVDKIKNMRIFQDENGKMNRSLRENNGEVLVVSQFTLLADVASGRRPSLSNAAPPAVARVMYQQLIRMLKESNLSVHEGRFKENMKVSLVNDGPVTLVIDTKAL